jgi:CO/xanthine dehydrogenase Mo-binding subunit
MDGQLYMKIRFSDRAHARVTAIHTGDAEALPGVVAIFTAKDIPVNEYGLVTKDQPVLCGPGSSKPGAENVRCYMDNVAVVVAETEALAAQAAKLIRVEYEDLQPVFDPFEAMQDGAPQLHENMPNNILVHYRTRHGDMEAGWSQADVVVEGEYSTGYQEHAYLQPEAGIGYIDEQGRVTVVVAGQWTHEDQDLICHALNLPHEDVRVVYPAIGGAFGGREDMSIQIVLALAVSRVRRPIKTIWSREESIRYHHKRHPITIKTRWGATRAGKIVAIEATVVGDCGPYNYTSTKVLANANLMVTGAYEVANCHVDTYAALTNNIPTGAFRGYPDRGVSRLRRAASLPRRRRADQQAGGRARHRPGAASRHELDPRGQHHLGRHAASGGCQYAAGDRGGGARKLLDSFRRFVAQERTCSARQSGAAARRRLCLRLQECRLQLRLPRKQLGDG